MAEGGIRYFSSHTRKQRIFVHQHEASQRSVHTDPSLHSTPHTQSALQHPRQSTTAIDTIAVESPTVIHTLLDLHIAARSTRPPLLPGLLAFPPCPRSLELCLACCGLPSFRVARSTSLLVSWTTPRHPRTVSSSSTWIVCRLASAPSPIPVPRPKSDSSPTAAQQQTADSGSSTHATDEVQLAVSADSRVTAVLFAACSENVVCSVHFGARFGRVCGSPQGLGRQPGLHSQRERAAEEAEGAGAGGALRHVDGHT